jgi:hypothetical protein
MAERPIESFEQYRSRVLGYLGSRDPMRVLRTTPRRLERLIAGRSRFELARRPAVGQWSVNDIAAHLADAELAFGWRIRNVVATPGVHLEWWDEHLWSEKLEYARAPVRASLAAYVALRVANLRVLRSLPPAVSGAAFGVHAKRGRQTLRDLVVMEAAHDLNHLGQVRALLLGRPRA